MRGIVRALRRLRDRDAGISITVVVVSMLTLLGVGAIVIDVGSLFEERRQLQNGADAAVLAIAYECAEDVVACQVDPDALAETFVDANARDLRARVVSVTIDPAERWVQVDAGTEETGGSNTVFPFLSQVLGNLGVDVRAAARATFESADELLAIPLTFSSCELDYQFAPTITNGVQDGVWTSFEAAAFKQKVAADVAGGGPGIYAEFFAKDPTPADDTDYPCVPPQGGGGGGGPSFDGPGAFGWLDEQGPCQAFIAFEEWQDGGANTGTSASQDCGDVLLNAYNNGLEEVITIYGPPTWATPTPPCPTPVSEPSPTTTPEESIYECSDDDYDDGVGAQGSNTSYFTTVFHGFVFEGMNFSGAGGKLKNLGDCDSDFQSQINMICGRFVTAEIPVGNIAPGGNTSTVYVVKLIPAQQIP